MKTKEETYLASELRAGILVTSALAVLIFLLFTAGKSQLFKDTQEVRVLFDYIGGLVKNAPVHLAGHQVGRVTDIRLSEENKGRLIVTAAISKEAVLHQDARAHVDILGFMGEKFLEIAPGSPDAPVLEPGTPLEGTSPVAFDYMVGQSSQLMSRMNDFMGENESKLGSIFANLDEASLNLKEMTHDLKLHPWKLLKKGKEKKK